MSLKDVGDSFFCANDDLERLVQNQPYMSFVIMSSLIEFIGKCYKRRLDFQTQYKSKEDYFDVINNLESLKKYREFNKEGQVNELYTLLRCGMLHALLPKEDMHLAPGSNDFNKKIIGASELYSDIKNAWVEVKTIPEILQYVRETSAIEVYDLTSDGTASNSSCVSGGTASNNILVTGGTPYNCSKTSGKH